MSLQVDSGNKLPIFARAGRAVQSSLRTGTEMLSVGTCLGILLMAFACGSDYFKEGSAMAHWGPPSSSEIGGWPALLLQLKVLLYVIGALLDTGINWGIGFALCVAIWRLVKTFVKPHASNTPSLASLSRKERRSFWLKSVGIFLLFAVVKIWPTPYAALVTDDGTVNHGGRIVRVLGKEQVYDWSEHRWCSQAEWFKKWEPKYKIPDLKATFPVYVPGPDSPLRHIAEEQKKRLEKLKDLRPPRETPKSP